ncbi:MAG: DMT family transporter [bacterium]|nr:DMT family transporter [bacterium]
MNTQQHNRELTLAASLLTVFLCATFGANAVAIKISLTGLGVFTTAAIRFGMAIAAISLWAFFTGRSFRVPRGMKRHFLLLSIIFTMQLGGFYIGLSKTNASRATLLINLQPFIILILAHFFIPGDRITLRKAAGLVLGFSGLAFVFLQKKGAGAAFNMGDIIVVIITLVWACNVIYVKRIIHGFEPFLLVLYQMIFAVPFYILAAILWDKTMIISVNSKVIWALLYQGLVTASFGFVTWTNLIKEYGAVSLHAYVFIMPISGVILSWLLLGEELSSNLLVALALITLGIVVVNIRRENLTFFVFRRGGM